MSSSEDLQKHFDLARRELLELSTSNRLLSTARDTLTGAGIEIKDEATSEVFRMLVTENKTMRFEEGELVEDTEFDEPAATDSTTADSISLGSEPGDGSTTTEAANDPGSDASAESAAATTPTRKRRTTKRRIARANQVADIHDDILHTTLEPNELDRRLNRLVTDSSAIMQEQGVNVLYLATGFLRWYEKTNPDRPRFAPLLLIPVRLSRGRGGGRYSLNYLDDEIGTNLTLKTRLLADFGIQFPDLPDVEEIVPNAYFKSVEQAIAGQPGWAVLPDEMVLWFFSFSKLLMFRDLDPQNWPAAKQLENQPLVRALLQDGFPSAPPLVDDQKPIDSLFDPKTTLHVIDSDSSQSLVVEEAMMGRSLVIQGPPGTGKSQTITNLIATAIAEGQRILFVAEKMAALEVVKSRLDNIGLGGSVLELHSNKTNKRQVLQEIEQTLKLGVPQVPADLDQTIERLQQRQAELNRYAEILHQPFYLAADSESTFDKSSLDHDDHFSTANQASSANTDDELKSSDSTGDDEPSTAATTQLRGAGKTPHQILSELIDLRSQQIPLPDFQIPEAAAWDKATYQSSLAAVNDLVAVINLIGDPESHPWRGSQLEVVLPLDLERLVASAPLRVRELEELTDAANQLATRFSRESPPNLLQIHFLLNAVEAYSKIPKVDPHSLAGNAWSDHREGIKQLADHARSVLLAKDRLSTVVNDAAWDADVSIDHANYALHGKKFFRMFYSDYRMARKTLKGMLTGKQPKTFEQRREILELLKNRHTGLKRLGESGVIGERAFGRFWLGLQTDWKSLGDWEAWEATAVSRGVPADFRAMVKHFDPPNELSAELSQLAGVLKCKLDQFLAGFRGLSSSLKLDLNEAFSKWNVESDLPSELSDSVSWLKNALAAPISELHSRIEAWAANPERLRQWQVYQRSYAVAQSIANGEFVKRVSNGGIAIEQASATFRFAYAEAVLREIFKKHPQLESFRQMDFEKAIDEFCDLDIKRIELARAQIAEAHWSWIGESVNPDMATAVSKLRHEMQKQRRHLPLRELLDQAGSAIQAVKPVFMMSPISVAQYLKPGVLEFDMLLIDEASQVRPIEALGAAARCKQMIVVGDDKQMPPTQFFGRVLGEIEDEEKDLPDMQAADVESILGLAIARNMPQRMLRWHYRSKHESLIAVSNREFYDNQLYVIPSPDQSGKLGVSWHFIENGKFLKGKNEIEAEIVAQAIMQHAKNNPKWTLGVAAFSITQRDAIISHLEKLRRADNSCEAFFDPSAPNPFFIKNLENVQGDERDVVFVSVGYGPGEDGRVALNFGPVSNSGGERRLNVLMTRAKQMLQIFSSMNPSDIDLSRATGRGPAALREYLQYAKNRTEGVGSHVRSADSDSPQELLAEVIQRELEGRGYQIDLGVGIAGIFVDLAVRDADNPGRYLVGIILDGLNYATARSARDRNRTTDGVLGAQGWIIHRIWSPEMFRKPELQINRMLETIENAKQGRARAKSVRLASSISIIERRAGTDPLALATGQVGDAGAAVARSRRTRTKSQPSQVTTIPPEQANSAESSEASRTADAASKPSVLWPRVMGVLTAMGSGLWQALTAISRALPAALKARKGNRMNTFIKVLQQGPPRKTTRTTRKKS